MLIVEPVLMQPLRREWEAIKTEARAARADYDGADNKREQAAARGKLEKLRERMLDKLRTVRVLDPACGSGNFLYMSLRALLDMEKGVLYHEDFMGVVLSEDRPKVHPRQMYGIEINPIAHDLATIVVWIGWIQWKINNGHRQYPEPVLQDLGQNVQQKDAILAFDADGEPTEPTGPRRT